LGAVAGRRIGGFILSFVLVLPELLSGIISDFLNVKRHIDQSVGARCHHFSDPQAREIVKAGYTHQYSFDSFFNCTGFTAYRVREIIIDLRSLQSSSSIEKRKLVTDSSSPI
jgi:hypothetical protein